MNDLGFRAFSAVVAIGCFAVALCPIALYVGLIVVVIQDFGRMAAWEAPLAVLCCVMATFAVAGLSYMQIVLGLDALDSARNG